MILLLLALVIALVLVALWRRRPPEPQEVRMRALRALERVASDPPVMHNPHD